MVTSVAITVTFGCSAIQTPAYEADGGGGQENEKKKKETKL